MKRAFALILMIVLCIALAVPAFAASDAFAPSVGKPDEFVPNIVADDDCLKLTASFDAETLPEAEYKELMMVYEALSDGSMTLPYDKVEGIDPEKMVIRDLVDISYFCTDKCDKNHAEELKKDGVTVTVTFELGVSAEDAVVVMSYVGGEWILAEKITNNGDGTVTVVFEDLCPVAIAVEA